MAEVAEKAGRFCKSSAKPKALWTLVSPAKPVFRDTSTPLEMPVRVDLMSLQSDSTVPCEI
jgi:hypothetical protein